MSGRWWWWPGGTAVAAGARAVLFFPPAGADQTIAAPLVPQLAGVRLGVLRMPGRGVRRDEQPPADLREVVEEVADGVADDVSEQGGAAPMLVGHSFGGLVAFAVAQALERRGVEVARLVVVASTPPHAWADHLASYGTQDREEYVARRVRTLLADGAVPAGIAGHPELGRAARQSLADDVRMSYGSPDTTPLRCPVTSVAARDDALVSRDAVRQWVRASTGDVDELVVPGGHFFYRDDPALLARLLRGELDALDGAYSHL